MKEGGPEEKLKFGFTLLAIFFKTLLSLSCHLGITKIVENHFVKVQKVIILCNG